jgi:oxygen-independent coproporphyrinogen-3 oxidase
MGVSSIGKVCDNYNQSVRDLEEYYRLIDAGKLPLERGIELEPDDLLRREAIIQLMCHFFLDLKALEEKWHFEYKLHFQKELEDLQVMQADGLLSIQDDILTVQPAGRLLVRNICMVFDKYLRDNQARVRFSKVI